jgi:hypothetical protein
VLRPGVERRLLDALLLAAGLREERAPLLRELLQVALGRDEPGPPQGVAVVVARHALDDPERPRVVLAGVVERAERLRAEALHVPQMEELVRDELEEILVAFPAGEGGGRREERGRRAVLQTAAGAAGQHEHERVVGVWQAAEERGIGGHDAPGVALEVVQVDDARVGSAPHGELVPPPRHLELAHRPGADVDGRVDELVEIVGHEGRAHGAQARHHAPARGRRDGDLVGRAGALGEPQVRRSAVHEGVTAVDVRGADSQLEGVHSVADDDLARPAELDAPGGLFDLGDVELHALDAARLDVLHVAGVVTDEVAAGCPARHAQDHRIISRLEVTKARLHVDEVRVWCAEGQTVARGRCHTLFG